MLYCRRVYSPARAADGYRILVDRLWPRATSNNTLPRGWRRFTTAANRDLTRQRAGRRTPAGQTRAAALGPCDPPRQPPVLSPARGPSNPDESGGTMRLTDRCLPRDKVIKDFLGVHGDIITAVDHFYRFMVGNER
ncbi:DUF488 family protein [Sodalis praecaptivus]|uniref:DUF488 family protein, N3 subclade n=1 Tax=Sodalis TaxID=84565 RepID=UPI0011DE3790|nr:DUF488 family protein [Sodalis praecaptivus]